MFAIQIKFRLHPCVMLARYVYTNLYFERWSHMQHLYVASINSLRIAFRSSVLLFKFTMSFSFPIIFRGTSCLWKEIGILYEFDIRVTRKTSCKTTSGGITSRTLSRNFPRTWSWHNENLEGIGFRTITADVAKYVRVNAFKLHIVALCVIFLIIDTIGERTRFNLRYQSIEICAISFKYARRANFVLRTKKWQIPFSTNDKLSRLRSDPLWNTYRLHAEMQRMQNLLLHRDTNPIDRNHDIISLQEFFNFKTLILKIKICLYY